MKFGKKARTILVVAFIIIFLLYSYISIRGQYLECAELGEQYIQTFKTNLIYKYSIMWISFVIVIISILITNRGIKKGLKPFFEQEKKEMPKLPNKSIALIIALIISEVLSNLLLEKVLLFVSDIAYNISFEETDIIFNLDISYYIFVKPLIQELLNLCMKLVLAISIYMTGYYILVFNFCFKAVDRKLLKESKLIKNLLKNAFIYVVLYAIQTIINSQNIVTGKFLSLNNGTELTGAGIIETTIQLVGNIGLAVLLVISAGIIIRKIKKGQTKKIAIVISSVPIYFILLFIVTVTFDCIAIKPNEYDKERKYISENIKSTKKAYNIEAEEDNINYSGTIKEEEIQENTKVINNIMVVNQDLVLQSLNDTQTESGYYTYRNASLQKYKINGEEQLIFVAPREIANEIDSYNNKTYEYTHGIGQVIVDATKVTEDGNIQYIQKDISGEDKIYNIIEPRIYYGLETNSVAVTNTKNKTEYDYTSENGVEHTSNYNGNSGIQVGFLDRLIIALRNGDLKLATSNSITKKSKILTNRNIIERAKVALPYLMYDENPYTVVSNGQIYWVIDAYTYSNQYPYSTYTEIEYNGNRQKINYIRNSAKVLINAYDGEMTFYITDRTDPIIMAYLNLYPTIFADYKEKEISQDIKEQLKYPEYLYKIQSNMLKVYHNIKPDVLYRNSDIWEYATYGTTSVKNQKSTLKPYYAMIKTSNQEETEFGLIQMYTQNEKSSIISYLMGTYDGNANKLKIYKYSADSNILGPVQLDSQIEQDETISKEIESLNVIGSKISKDMKIIPINNTVLYIETIYQTMTNEPNQPTTLKKVIVASGTKLAIGNTLKEAVSNLLSKSAVDIEINNTEDIEGLLKAIIDANNNLTESNGRNDWEMIGSDLKELQELINILEEKLEKEKSMQ